MKVKMSFQDSSISTSADSLGGFIYAMGPDVVLDCTGCDVEATSGDSGGCFSAQDAALTVDLSQSSVSCGCDAENGQGGLIYLHGHYATATLGAKNGIGGMAYSGAQGPFAACLEDSMLVLDSHIIDSLKKKSVFVSNVAAVCASEPNKKGDIVYYDDFDKDYRNGATACEANTYAMEASNAATPCPISRDVVIAIVASFVFFQTCCVIGFLIYRQYTILQLLQKALPKEIVPRVLRGKRDPNFTISIHDGTVLFLDIVGYTRACSQV